VFNWGWYKYCYTFESKYLYQKWLKLNANELKDFMLLKKISTSVEMTA